jgi:ADP-ribosylation factor GTPase-activating protein 2/3
MNQTIDNTERDAIFEKLKTVNDNGKCFDCDKKNPKWASVYLGVFLCIDCAGKHREYSVKYSFVRSLTLDTWSRKQITFLEIGGNSKAAEFFKKNGQSKPFDYKTTLSQKYQADLTKKVEALLNTHTSITQTKEETPEQVKTENKQISSNSLQEDEKQPETTKKPSNPFENNIVIDTTQSKPKNFSVEFTKKSASTTGAKKGLAAKKIDDFDLESLSLEEDSKINKNQSSGFNMTENQFSTSSNNDAGVREISSKTNYTSYTTDVNSSEKLKQMNNAKAISSESFKDKSEYQPSNMQKFNGSNSISSAQYFGEKEEDPGRDYAETVENVKEFVTQIGGKLKEKAGSIFDKVKTQWQERGSG